MRRFALTLLSLGLSLPLSARVAAADTVSGMSADPTVILELHDPQLDAATGGTFPPLGGSLDLSSPQQPPVVDNRPVPDLRVRDLSGDSPMAPLPPAIVAGPIGIAIAGWMAHRANRRGGRI
jgi:hypothetical protein